MTDQQVTAKKKKKRREDTLFFLSGYENLKRESEFFRVFDLALALFFFLKARLAATDSSWLVLRLVNRTSTSPSVPSSLLTSLD